MSKKSPPQKHVLIYNPNVYTKYFRELAERLGATDIDDHQRLNYTLRLAANFRHKNRLISVEIILDWSRKGICWILSEMDIEPGEDILDPSEDFLPAKSMRLANQEDIDCPSDEIYRIRSASDLAALLVAYDWWADETGKVKIFGH